MLTTEGYPYVSGKFRKMRWLAWGHTINRTAGTNSHPYWAPDLVWHCPVILWGPPWSRHDLLQTAAGTGKVAARGQVVSVGAGRSSVPSCLSRHCAAPLEFFHRIPFPQGVPGCLLNWCEQRRTLSTPGGQAACEDWGQGRVPHHSSWQIVCSFAKKSVTHYWK